MARENTVSIKVLLDSEEAKQKLAELQQKLDTLINRSSSANSTSGGNGNAGSSSSPSSSNNGANGISNTLRNLFNREGQNFGNNASKGLLNGLIKSGIGLVIAKQITSKLNDFMELDILSRTHPGESTYDLQKQKVANSGLKGLLGGGLAGFALGGPLGALVGMIGGGAYSLFKGSKELQENQRIFNETQRHNIEVRNADIARSVSNSVGEQSFQYRLNLNPSRGGRISIIQDRMKSLSSQIRKAEAELDEWTDSRLGKKFVDEITGEEFRIVQDKNSEAVRAKQKEIAALQSQRASAAMAGFQEKYLKDRLPAWMGADFTDSYSARGISIGGGSFDVSKANEPIITRLSSIDETLKKIETFSLKGTAEKMSESQLASYLQALGGGTFQ